MRYVDALFVGVGICFVGFESWLVKWGGREEGREGGEGGERAGNLID